MTAHTATVYTKKRKSVKQQIANHLRMAVAEFPLPPFPYEKDFFGNPFPKGGKKSALPIFGKKLNEEKSNGQTRKRT